MYVVAGLFFGAFYKLSSGGLYVTHHQRSCVPVACCGGKYWLLRGASIGSSALLFSFSTSSSEELLLLTIVAMQPTLNQSRVRQSKILVWMGLVQLLAQSGCA